MNVTIEQAAEALGISRQALGKWRRRAKKEGHLMTPVGVYNEATGRMVKGLSPGQLRTIRILRKAAGQ